MEKVSKVLQGGMRASSHYQFSFVGCLGRIIDDAKMIDCMRKLAPECSRATSAAAHGARGCCGMPFFFSFFSSFLIFRIER